MCIYDLLYQSCDEVIEIVRLQNCYKNSHIIDMLLFVCARAIVENYEKKFE